MENFNLQWDNRFKIIFTSTKIEVLKFAWSFPIHSIRHILKLIIHLFMTREHNCNLVLSSPYNLKFKLISKINHSIMLMHYYYYYKYMNIIIIVLILNSENYDGNNWMYFFGDEMVNTFTPLDHHSYTKELNKSLLLPHTRGSCGILYVKENKVRRSCILGTFRHVSLRL